MSYTTRDGDTFEVISRNVYGVQTEATLLRQANPGTIEPMPAGVVIKVPSRSTRGPLGVAATETNEVAVVIGGKVFARWESVTVTRNLDTLDTYELTAPFEPDDATFRDIFEPMSFSLVVITVGGTPLFTGTQLTPTPSVTAARRSVTAAGYGLPGVPLAFNGLTLAQLAAQLAAPFGVPVVFEASSGAAFEQVELKPTEPVLPFLIRLAKQRGLIVGNNTAGALVFRKPSRSVPVARLVEGLSPLLSVLPQFDPQSYYSDVTGIEPTAIGNSGGQQVTVKNPAASDIMRPRTIDVADVAAGELQSAVDSAFGRMLASTVSYSAEVSTWRNQLGGLWAPGDTITVQAPGAMIYSSYDFMIRSVTFRRQDSATLSLVLPESFDGTTPRTMPWQS
jgi:prophage tail gpP-like protein/phage tail protein X